MWYNRIVNKRKAVKMRKFVVTVDVTMSGDIEIEAPNAKAAADIIQGMYFTSQELRNFHEFSKDIYEVEEVK